MKVPLDRVADNLPPPEKPFPVSAVDARVSEYRGLGTHLSLWEDAAQPADTQVRWPSGPATRYCQYRTCADE